MELIAPGAVVPTLSETGQRIDTLDHIDRVRLFRTHTAGNRSAGLHDPAASSGICNAHAEARRKAGGCALPVRARLGPSFDRSLMTMQAIVNFTAS